MSSELKAYDPATVTWGCPHCNGRITSKHMAWMRPASSPAVLALVEAAKEVERGNGASCPAWEVARWDALRAALAAVEREIGGA